MLTLIVSKFRNSATTNLFEPVLGSIARDLSTNRVCEASTISEDNIASTDIIELYFLMTSFFQGMESYCNGYSF